MGKVFIRSIKLNQLLKQQFFMESQYIISDSIDFNEPIFPMEFYSMKFVSRIFWITMLTICGLSACYIGNELWLKFRSKPTQLAVKDTHVPLYEFPFPSITICPAIKVKKTKGLEYFSR